MLRKLSKLFLQNKITFVFLFLVITFAIVARFFYLDKFPGGMDPDSMEVVLSSKTIFNFGTDSSGTKIPNFLFSNNTKAGIAGLPSLVLSPLIGGLNLNLAGLRIVFVVINVLTVFLISLTLYEYTKKEIIFLLSLIVGLINPWMFFYSRIPTEAPFSLLLFVLGMYFLAKNNKKLILPILFFVASFYAYFGAKPVVLLLVPIFLIILFIKNKKKNLSKISLALITFLLLTGLYFPISFSNKQDTFSRRKDNEILLVNMDSFSGKVNEQRQSSMESPFKNLIYNKLSYSANEFIRKYTSWLSYNFLIGGGDLRGIYTFGDYGMVYLLSLPFYIIGFSQIIFIPELIGLLLVAPLPSALSLNGDSYFYRSFLLIPVFISLISLGLVYLYDLVNKKFKTVFLIFLSLGYFFSFLIFLNFYFFRYPVDQYQNNYLDGRIISSYLKRSGENIPITVSTTSPYSVFNDYLFYTGKFKEAQNYLSVEKFNYEFSNIIFNNKCPEVEENKVYFVDSKLDCDYEGVEMNFLSIQNPDDAGVNFKIYNDKLCEGKKLDPYKEKHFISDYSVEKLTNLEFCQRWIHKENE